MNPSSGTYRQVVERYSYTPYGEVTFLDANFAVGAANGTISAIDNVYLYTGRERDPETGLYNFRTRPYHAALGRFTTRDWIRYWGGMNLYGYVGGNAPSYYDPYGLAKTRGKKVIPQGEFCIQTTDGTEICGYTADELRDALDAMNDAGQKIDWCVIKGHGDVEGVFDDADEPFLEILPGAGKIRTGRRSAGRLWPQITTPDSRISLRGCNTAPAACTASETIPGTISGTPTYVIGIPGTTKMIGPWKNFKGGKRK